MVLRLSLRRIKSTQTNLFIVQKKAIRATNNLQYRDHTNNYFKSIEILKLTEIINMNHVYTYIKHYFKIMTLFYIVSIHSKRCTRT